MQTEAEAVQLAIAQLQAKHASAQAALHTSRLVQKRVKRRCDAAASALLLVRSIAVSAADKPALPATARSKPHPPQRSMSGPAASLWVGLVLAGARPPPGTALCCAQHRSPSIFSPQTYGPRPVTTFRHHAPLSIDLVAAHASSHAAPASWPDVLADFGYHTAAYQAAAAQRGGLQRRDVCWFLQLPWQVAPGVPLSFSTQIGSDECCASSSLAMSLLSLEEVMLRSERRLLGLDANEGRLPAFPSDDSFIIA
jgi:hypothetical protein